MQYINKISIGFFQASSSWIVFPEYVEFYISEDGTNFKASNKIINESSIRNPDWVQKDFTTSLENVKARYVKIFAKKLAELPSFHHEGGGKQWRMVDEIIVE